MADKKPIRIVKSTGEESYFSAKKLAHSLQRSGADESKISSILDEVRKKLYPGISTKEIYRTAFSSLRSQSRHLAARYNLKQSIIDLGPEGFYFEQYIAAIMSSRGHEARNGVIMNGKCVTHEVDVLTKKDGTLNIMECKFHKHDGLNCDVKVPLYIHSRFNDIVEWLKEHPVKDISSYKGWVINNTRFTDDAIRYGTCAGLELLSWNYPEGKGLREMIDNFHLYPITCLTSITKNEKNLILEKGIILCKDIPENTKVLKQLRFSVAKISSMMEEVRQLCDGKPGSPTE